MCERVHGVCGLDTTDTTNSLTHLVSCWNLMIFHLKTPHFGVRKFWSWDCSVHKHELSRNLVLCHVTYISTNQNALNFKISRENVRFQAIFFPFKEQSCYTALLKMKENSSVWSQLASLFVISLILALHACLASLFCIFLVGFIFCPLLHFFFDFVFFFPPELFFVLFTLVSWKVTVAVF